MRGFILISLQNVLVFFSSTYSQMASLDMPENRLPSPKVKPRWSWQLLFWSCQLRYFVLICNSSEKYLPRIVVLDFFFAMKLGSTNFIRIFFRQNLGLQKSTLEILRGDTLPESPSKGWEGSSGSLSIGGIWTRCFSTSNWTQQISGKSSCQKLPAAEP